MQKAPMSSPERMRRLIQETVERLGLNLRGLTVLTEAATNNFAVTPVVAAVAGAKVLALAKDSPHGTMFDAQRQVTALGALCGCERRIEVVWSKTSESVSRADIVTNLGFVRPLDRQTVDWMKETAIIVCMYEDWEFRSGDVDLDACRRRGIPVVCVDEEHPLVNSFRYCGLLCVKMLFEAGVEVYKSRVVVVSKDKFGRVVRDHLHDLGADVHLVLDLKEGDSRELLRGSDAVVLADYHAPKPIIASSGGQITGRELREIAEGVAVVQFTGGADFADLRDNEIRAVPEHRVERQRMGATLADLGPRPVIDIHAGGLKAAAIVARSRLKGVDSLGALSDDLSGGPGKIVRHR